MQVKTLDQVFAREPTLGNQRVSLVWLDIQGHEGHFFLGARHLLTTGIPVVAELWPYAIARSGMTRAQFCRIVSELFTHFYLLSNERGQALPVSAVDRLFDAYSTRRQMCQLAFVRKP